MKFRLFTWICGGVILIVCLVAITSFSSITKADQRGCGPNCGPEKATSDVQKQVADNLTAKAAPTVPGAEKSPIPIDYLSTPIVAITPKRLEGDDRTVPGMDYTRITDAWLVGTVRGSPYAPPGIVYVIARRPFEDVKTSSIGYYAMGTPPAEGWDQYTKFWTAPNDIGEITITSITAPNGIVSFKTSTDVIGTFDLSKHVWSFK